MPNNTITLYETIITIQGQASTIRVKKDNSNYENNYELSFARAVNTKELLIKELASKNVNIKFILSAIATENSDNTIESQKAQITLYNWKEIEKSKETELTITEHFSSAFKKIKDKFIEEKENKQ